MSSVCNVSTCRKPCKRWFCAHHWFRVKRETKAALFRAWRAWKKGLLSNCAYANAIASAAQEAKAGE